MIDLSSLNANQLESVNWNEGPLLVLAGPGSGKTQVLTYRIARIIEESAGKHFRILGITFTNKAAAEMRKRIEALVPNAGERTLLTTFHSFCVGLLRQHGHHIGLRPDFTILSQEVDRRSVLNDAIERTRKEYGEVTYRCEQLLPFITRLLDYNVLADSAIEVLQEHNIKSAEVIGATYKYYRKLMRANNELDFSGLLAETIELLQEKPAIRKQINRIYPYICVDEFQDTNLAQYRILCNITNPYSKNLFVVADDDQIIYQWNGANPERLKELRSDFNLSVLQLPENYRCPPEVIEIANKLIKYNLTHDKNKLDLIARKQSNQNDVIQVKDFVSFDEEADWVASDIALRAKETRCNCVVLARNHRLLGEVLTKLKAHNVLGYIAVRKDEFVSNPMVWLHAMLRLANARHDREQLRRVCKSFSDLKGMILIVEDIISDAEAEEGDFLRAWQRAALQKEHLDNETKQFLIEAVSKLADKLDFWTFIKDSFAWFEKQLGFGSVSNYSITEYEEEKTTWNNLTNEVIGELGRDQVTLNVLLQGLDLRSKTPSPPDGAVPCYTIHASKGMEFDHVYLVGLVEDQIPSWQARKRGENSDEMQEERRNCFVAITRVQQSLTLTYSHRVFGWATEPSRFLKEMELVHHNSNKSK